jgi:hypothetical protein
MKANEAFDSLSGDARIDLLASLGFEDTEKYRGWEESNLRFCHLLYDVATELIKCWQNGKWTATPKATVKATRASQAGQRRPLDMNIIVEGMEENLAKIAKAMERRGK